MSYTDSQNIQYKASTGQVNLDQAQGIVECFVAGIGNKDSVGDVCATGAFAKSLLRRKPRVVWGHNWNDPIGKVLEMYEVPPNDPRLPAKMRSAGIGGLYAKVQFNLNSEKGKEAFANVAFFGEEQEWSIGYKTLRAQFDQGSQANILYEVELYEVSPVLHGANQLTGTISVKNAEGNTPMVMPAMQGMPNIPEDEVQRKLQEELSLQTGSKVKISSVEDGAVTFTMGEEDAEESYKCRFHNDNGTFMFSTPQRINKPMQMPGQMQPMMPMGMPSRPMVPQNPNQTVVVPQVLPGGMPNQMPLVQIDYVGEDSSSKPQGKPKLVQEEADLAEALIKITKRHGKFNEDANGVWAGYKPAAENMVAKIGVKCSNCVMYEGNGVCKIIALKVEDGGKCRFAVIPEGVVKVSPIKKQEVTEEMQEEEVKWLKEIEDRHPEVFINGDLRHAVKRKRDALVPAVKLTRIGEYSVKSASNEIYYLPVSQEDAFSMKQAIDPIIDYYRAEAYVDDGGIVFTSGVNKDFAEAVNNAVKALGRNLAGRTARAGRGMAARFNPKAWDGDNDGLVQEGTPYQRPAIPGINDFGTRGVVDAARATAAYKKPKGASKKPVADRRGLSSGKRDLSRHSNRDRDLEKQFPNAEENAKREAHDKLIDAWEAGMDMSFTTIGRQQDERGGRFSEDFLRGRELGYNDARSRWFGKGTAEQPKDFDPKAKASGKYSSWYRDVVSQLGRGKATRPEDADREQQYAGIDAGMKDFLMSVAPDTSNWAEEDRASLAKLENDYGFGRGGLSSGRGIDPSLGDPANITPEEAAARTDDIGANFRYLFVSPDAVAFKYNGKMREIRAESDNGIYDSLRRSKAGAIYFGGIDSESGEYRTFRLDRIEGLIPGASRQSTSSGPYSRAGMSSGRRGLSSGGSGYNMPPGVYESDIPGWDDPEPDYNAVNDWEWDELPADVTDEINKDIEEYILNRDKSAPDNVAREIDKDGNLGIDDKTTIIEQDGIKYVANPARSQADILEQILASNMVRYTKTPDKKKLLESMRPWRGYVQDALDGGQLTDEEAEKLYRLLDGIESEIKDPSNTPFDAINRALKDIGKIANDADKRWRDSTGADPSDEVFIKGWRKLYRITQDGPRNAGRGVDQNSIYRLMDNWQDARYRGKISDDGKYEIEDLNSFAKNVINGGELDYEVDDEGFTQVSDPAYFISDFDKFAAQGYSTGFSSGRRGMSSGLKFEPIGDAHERIDPNNESSLRKAAIEAQAGLPKVEEEFSGEQLYSYVMRNSENRAPYRDEIRNYQLAKLEHALKVREEIVKAVYEKNPDVQRQINAMDVYDFDENNGGPLRSETVDSLADLDDFIQEIRDEVEMFEDRYDRKSQDLEDARELIPDTYREIQSAKLELEVARMDLDEGDIELDEYTKLVKEINSRVDKLNQQLDEYRSNRDDLAEEVSEASFFGDGKMSTQVNDMVANYMNFSDSGNPRSARRAGISSGRREMMQDTIAADENSARRESLLDADMPETDRMYSSFMSRPSSERASAFASYRRETGKSPNPNDPSFKRWIAGLESDLIMREDSGEMSGRDSGRGLSSGRNRKKG